MGKRPKHLDSFLKDWPYEFGEVAARAIEGADGRALLQLRIDMGVLQMETTGRPDGSSPGGFATFYDYLLALAFEEGEEFQLDCDRCLEIDREFVQFYHRRLAWLSLREFRNAVADADHTLGLMDFSSAHAPDEEWADMHEQYRPLVLFHRTQAAALAELRENSPQRAVAALEEGLTRMREVFCRHDMLDLFEEDELVEKLLDMKEGLSEHYDLETSLSEQLSEAIAEEHYELAAEIRDRLARRTRNDA
ncbi:MAG: UvrB/UvrC motif-containing protein [Planctomycetales bacterium]|nr:UvrB/UvrC motif-containing protein [Planctomycetales bacterium]